MSRRTLSIAGSNRSDLDNSLKNNGFNKSDKNKKYLKIQRFHQNGADSKMKSETESTNDYQSILNENQEFLRKNE